ncbi:hypothetical protein SAMN06295879_0375 [Agreia bicolorata]|uniref:Amidohydrolase 3 domain-containing protein n=1 Tax=Agreia bicolorata TaxID=110935 RepID=A0A1T4WXY0_9MICO|nr:amidohydrolase [Agreia bicolorata]SKA81725.1 hypothetical protein SAMN06295879_0375 [Agreia bicolorata]
MTDGSTRKRGGADLIVVNALITTLADDATTAPEVEAIVVRGDRIVFAGTSEEAEAFRGPDTRWIDADGARVVPGLIDSHIHMVRSGHSWNGEIRWGTQSSLKDALASVSSRAQELPPGTWIQILGGWHPDQFVEGRGPSAAELDEAAPDHPVFVQCLYDWGLLNSVGAQHVGLTPDAIADLDPAGFEYDEQGNLTGRLWGMPMLKWAFQRIPKLSIEEQVAGTARVSRELARAGLTGVIDGGGVTMGPDAYEAVYETWRRGELSVRTRLMLHSSGPGAEFDEIGNFLRYVRIDAGDGMLRVNGGGEIVLYRSHDGMTESADVGEDAAEELYRIFRMFAQKRWTVHMHAIQADTADAVLTAWERVSEEFPVRDLRWAIVHGDNMDTAAVERLGRLGAGLLTQALYWFQADTAVEHWSDPASETSPFLAAIKRDIRVGLGSDGLRANTFDPFSIMSWFVTGVSINGSRTLSPAHRLTREEALRAYTVDAAWFSFEEEQRGRLQPGTLADFVVLSDDYFTVAEDDIRKIRSVLTVLGGRATHSDLDGIRVDPQPREVTVDRV